MLAMNDEIPHWQIDDLQATQNKLHRESRELLPVLGQSKKGVRVFVEHVLPDGVIILEAHAFGIAADLLPHILNGPVMLEQI